MHCLSVLSCVNIHTCMHAYICVYVSISCSYSVWSPRNCIPVVDLLDEWIPLFSDWIVTNVLDQLIMPKLHVRPYICTYMCRLLHRQEYFA